MPSILSPLCAIPLALFLTSRLLFAAEAEILTPKPGPKPRINGPAILGARPRSPILYYIPVTGNRPMEYAARNLPHGLAVDSATGILSGHVTSIGEYDIILEARNALGAAKKSFRIVVGDTIALTPPMGWNSWNCWGGEVSQEKVMSSARAMVEKGLRDHGWRFVNIDDGWQGKRGGEFNAIESNSKFPDMRKLGDDLHALGLNFGIYSSPWQCTYAGHIGSTGENEEGTYSWIESGDHNKFFRISKDDESWNVKRRRLRNFGPVSFVENDVKQWAAWGVDYLKYDWNPNDVPHTREMADALRASGRDVVFSLSNAAPLNETQKLSELANVWRTTGDIEDSWKSMSGIGFDQGKWAKFQKPGHYNDPDMLVVGQVGWGNPHPTRLTPDEQYTHISLWCLLSAPLLLGCDLAALDEFTLGLLTNDEVLALDQDSLCKPAIRVVDDDGKYVYRKELEDGTIAVGLFNTTNETQTISVSLETLKLAEPQIARDLWRQKDEGKVTDKYSATVASHGVKLIGLSPAK